MELIIFLIGSAVVIFISRSLASGLNVDNRFVYKIILVIVGFVIFGTLAILGWIWKGFYLLVL